MKLIKINTDHYIIVDDSEIKEGDWYYWEVTKTIQIAKLDSLNRFPKSSDGSKKITHSTQPLEDYGNKELNDSVKTWLLIKYLDLSEVQELIGEVDVEKKAEDYKNKKGSIPTTELEDEIFKLGYKDGYNQALEDNKEKKYTEKDIDKAYWAGMQFVGEDKGSFGEFIQSLQPKTEWEVEIVDGKLKLL